MSQLQSEKITINIEDSSKFPTLKLLTCTSRVVKVSILASIAILASKVTLALTLSRFLVTHSIH